MLFQLLSAESGVWSYGQSWTPIRSVVAGGAACGASRIGQNSGNGEQGG
jgi:hypothetical protein